MLSSLDDLRYNSVFVPLWKERRARTLSDSCLALPVSQYTGYFVLEFILFHIHGKRPRLNTAKKVPHSYADHLQSLEGHYGFMCLSLTPQWNLAQHDDTGKKGQLLDSLQQLLTALATLVELAARTELQECQLSLLPLWLP